MYATKSIKKEALEILSRDNWFPAVAAFMLALISTITANFILAFIVSCASLAAESFSQYILNEILPNSGEMNTAEIVTMTESLPDLITGLLAILLFVFSFLLLLPLIMGCMKYIRLIAIYGSVPFREVFCYLSKNNYKKAMNYGAKTALSCFWRIIVSLIPFFVVQAILTEAGLFDNSLDFSALLCYFILCVVLFLSILLSAYLCKKFVFSVFAFFDNENITTKEALYHYSLLPKETKNAPFNLFVSLSGWWLLSVIVIPVVFIIPYALMCFFVLQKRISFNNQTMKDEI